MFIHIEVSESTHFYKIGQVNKQIEANQVFRDDM